MQNRALRIDTDMVSAFSDGSTIFRGLVANVSKTGLKITNITAKFQPATRKYSSVVSNRDQKFKLNILPVWFHHNGQRLEVGFKIVSPTPDWSDYLDSLLDDSLSAQFESPSI